MASVDPFGYPHPRETVARVGGLMMLAGSALALVLTAVDPAYSNGHAGVVVVACAVAIAIGLAMEAAPARVPRWAFNAVPAVAAALVCVTQYVTNTPTDGSELLLLWPVLFAAYFLTTRAAWATAGFAIVAYTMLAVDLLGHHDGLSPAANLAATAVMTLLVVMGLRKRLMLLLRVREEEARTDPLTGLLNRRGFDDAFEIELARADRYGTELVLFAVDIDHFKELNDRHGHQAGDDALVALAEALRSRLPRVDVAARVGGEEFAVLLPRCSLAVGRRRADDLRRALTDTTGPGVPPFTISVGVAALSSVSGGRAALLAAADRALYAAKEAGRDRVC